jgi:peptidoglycan biosynthesis protein MviN/MurJ (putative lipid II flippase)
MMRYRTKLLVPLLLGLGIIATFMREVAIAFYYGSGRTVEIYKIAFAMPYAFFQSLGSILIGGLLPILINIGPENIKVIEKKVYLFFVVLFFFMLATVDIQSKYLAPGFNSLDQHVLKDNLSICWLIMVFSALIFPKRLLLQAQGKSVLVSSTSLIFSLAFIPMLFRFHDDFIDANLALFSIASVFIVYLFYLFFTSNTVDASRIQLNITKKITRKIYSILFSSIIYVLFLSFPRLIDRAFASEYDQGVVANLDYAMNFYVAFGVLIGTSCNILMAKKIAVEYKISKNKLIWLWSLLSFPVIITIVIILLLLPNVNLLIDCAYNRGAFDLKSINEVSTILYWFLVTLPVMVAGMIISQVLAAFNVFYLILIMFIKIAVKYISFIYTTNDLGSFGKTTLIMEVTGFLFMIIFYLFINLLAAKKISK